IPVMIAFFMASALMIDVQVATNGTACIPVDRKARVPGNSRWRAAPRKLYQHCMQALSELGVTMRVAPALGVVCRHAVVHDTGNSLGDLRRRLAREFAHCTADVIEYGQRRDRDRPARRQAVTHRCTRRLSSGLVGKYDQV